MSNYQIYRLHYLFQRLDQILVEDLMIDVEFVFDVIRNPIRQIIIPLDTTL